MPEITPELLFERLNKYVDDILNGNIKACKKHIWACERFKSDMSKTQEENYDYYFDIDELYRFYMWCAMFKHRVGILVGKPILLVDFQLFLCGNIFCWKKKKNGLRRFRKVYVQVGRKNANDLAC